jgi:hypothetical protein
VVVVDSVTVAGGVAGGVAVVAVVADLATVAVEEVVVVHLVEAVEVLVQAALLTSRARRLRFSCLISIICFLAGCFTCLNERTIMTVTLHPAEYSENLG